MFGVRAEGSEVIAADALRRYDFHSRSSFASHKGVPMIAKLRTSPEEQQIRLSGIPWAAYVAFGNCLGERNVRVTYDQGEMEVMSLSFKHENRKSRLKSLLVEVFVEMEMDVVCGGSMTCRREEMLKGLEPDDCYWIAHEPQIRSRDEVDLNIDPPPDLVTEIEISRSTLDRMPIYAALKIPEVWCWDEEMLRILTLTARGVYRPSKRSKAFPFLPLDEFASFLTRTDLGEMKLIRAFRSWVRENSAIWKIA
jgi:Uma2 family endonuclease